MKDFWAGDGSGLGQFCRRTKDKRARARRRILREYADKGDLPGDTPWWPFVHNLIGEMDPLVIPLVSWLGSVNGVTTIASCQGHADGAPYVHFRCDQPAFMEVAKRLGAWRHDQLHELHYWDTPVVTHQGVLESQPTWLIQFYDTLALMNFNATALNIPLEAQLQEVPQGTVSPRGMAIIPDISAIKDAVQGRRPRRKA